MKLEPKVGLCECGHRIYEHGRRKPPSSPRWEYTACSDADCNCMGYRDVAIEGWPHGAGP